LLVPDRPKDRRESTRVSRMVDIRIALAQIDTCVGDVDTNSRTILEWSRRAAAEGAQVVAFPEMTITGYPIEDLALRASFQRAARAAVQTIADQLVADGLGDLTVVLGTVGAPQVTRTS